MSSHSQKKKKKKKKSNVKRFNSNVNRFKW